jgi:hypothetical protein
VRLSCEWVCVVAVVCSEGSGDRRGW